MRLIRNLIDWVRFRGWHNAYWREDAWSSRCPHNLRTWLDGDLFCMDCGTPLAHTVSGASNSTHHVEVSA